MKVVEIKARAKAMGLAARGKRKLELIRSIQTQEGNFPCFGTSSGQCDQQDCCWRDDCLPRDTAFRC